MLFRSARTSSSPSPASDTPASAVATTGRRERGVDQFEGSRAHPVQRCEIVASPLRHVVERVEAGAEQRSLAGLITRNPFHTLGSSVAMGRRYAAGRSPG